MKALTNRPKEWVTAMYVHLNYIFRDQGNEYLSEFKDPVDSDFGQDSIYYLAPVCPHLAQNP